MSYACRKQGNQTVAALGKSEAKRDEFKSDKLCYAHANSINRGRTMPHKFIQGDKLPKVTFNLRDGRTITLPDEMQGRYLVLLFYRGNW